jgi:predicted ATPase
VDTDPRAVAGRVHNLPLQRGRLTGRDRDVVAARQILLRDDVGLLPLTGPGGVGKTRLAIQVAAELVDRFEDGVFFVELASIVDPALVPSTIARALGAVPLRRLRSSASRRGHLTQPVLSS